MGMTIDDIIVKEQEMSESFQKTVNTHMVSEDLSLEELYCDDTEIIEEELKRCQELADFHNQIANTMRKYQKIEQIVAKRGYFIDDKYFLISEVLEDGKID